MEKNSDFADPLAIVILNWNGKKWLDTFLPGVIQHSGSHKIYVIDNASTDDSVKFLQQNFPTVGVVQNNRNFGFAGGYNEGLKSIKAEIFCLLNSDVEVTENWTVSVLKLLNENKDIAAVQPKILSYKNRDEFEFAGAAGGLLDNLGYPYCRGRIFDDVEKDLGQYSDEREILWASGCCFFVKAEDFWSQKGFDERFFAHQEEIDLCWRLFNTGKKIFYTGKSTVYHVGGGTLEKQNPRKTYLNIRNNLSMLAKNLPFPSVLFIIFFRLILDGIAAVFFGWKLGFAHFIAVIKAHFAFYAALPETVRRRKKHQRNDYYSEKWLVFKNFLNNKK